MGGPAVTEPGLSLSSLARILRAAADEAERIASEQSAEQKDWIDQASSPLGRRRHCAAVRRRIASGKGDAAQVGRRFLLSAQALSEELAALSKGKVRVLPTTGPDALRHKLGLMFDAA